MSTTLRAFLDFNLWANLRLLDACAALEDAALDATCQGTYGSIRETWLHVAQGEEAYVFRFTGQRPEDSLRGMTQFPGFDRLRDHLKRSGEDLLAIANQFDAEQMLHIEYDGKTHNIPAIVVLIQAVDHGIDHRSQIATLLSQQGVNPPEIDSWAYFDAVIEPTQSH
jgi:uncharacterized damage-inducible protein DinB